MKQWCVKSLALVLASGTIFVARSPVRATQQLFCNGRMSNGRAYSAEYVDGRFTKITWTAEGQPPQVSRLTYDTVNSDGQPIYRGSLFAAVAVTLVDLSGGDVRPGSQVSVGVEEWGWARGTCGRSDEPPPSSDWFSSLRNDLMGLEPGEIRTVMERNNFSFVETVEHTSDRIVERWTRHSDGAPVYVVIDDGTRRVRDVLQMF